MISRNLLGGLIGSITLNIIHQLAKQFDREAPEVDLIGEEALSKTIKAAGFESPAGKALFASTLGADLASNAAYYSLVGIGGSKHLMLKGAVLGAAAGLGVLKLTPAMGLDDSPVKKSRHTEILTVVWYMIGGLATAAAIKGLQK